MPGANPLETAVSGFVRISNVGPYGFAVGGYSRDSAADVRSFRGNDNVTVTNIARARQIARDYHDWDIISDEEIATKLMRGENH